MSDQVSPDFINLANPVKLPRSVPTESYATTHDTTTRLGGWLFRHRTSLPLPAAMAILTLRIAEAPPSALLVGAGVAITVIGELIRL